jgi:hypothetical protein
MKPARRPKSVLEGYAMVMAWRWNGRRLVGFALVGLPAEPWWEPCRCGAKEDLTGNRKLMGGQKRGCGAKESMVWNSRDSWSEMCRKFAPTSFMERYSPF